MKRILITGASGFIGGFLVQEALKRGYEVYAGIRKTSNREHLLQPGINILELDFTDKTSLQKTFQKYGHFHYVVHAAGITKTCHTDTFYEVNDQYTRNLMRALRDAGNPPDKFLYISSLAAYGPGNPKTLKPVRDEDTPHPVTEYGKSKLKAEQYIQSQASLPYIIFRPTGVYGPGEKDYYLAYKSINHRIETYVGTKEQYLTFVHVADLSRLVLDALASKVINKSYFVTDLKQYTVVEFNRMVRQILHKKTVTIVFPKFFLKAIVVFTEKLFCLFGKTTALNKDKYHELTAKNWLCESDAIVNDFGFRPDYDLKKGLTHTIAWYVKEKLL